jgi:methionyl aminopeptidase
MSKTEIIIKNKASIHKMRKAGRLLAQIMQEVEKLIKPGQNTLEIDAFIEKRMLQEGLVPECKGYAGYRYATCISLNDVIVHGVPSEKNVLKNGDFVKIDVVGSYKGYCADIARYYFVGNVDVSVKKLASVVQCALDAAIDAIKPGIHLSDVSVAIQDTTERAGFNVVRDFVGHGIGKSMHEAPEIPNFGKPGNGPVLREGMTLALEPMITEKGHEVRVMPDGWTAKTRDGGLSAHVEDTVLVTSDGSEVLTRIESHL